MFFLPGRRAHREGRHASPTPSGCCSGTTRRSSPPGDARSELWFYYQLGQRIREKLAGLHRRDGPPAARPDLGLPDARARWPEPDAPRRCCARSTAPDADGGPLSAYTELKADGSTALRAAGSTAASTPTGVNQAARRKPALGAGLGRARVGLGVAGQPAHPLQPRVGGPGRQAVERAQGLRLVGRRAAAAGPGTTCRTSSPTSRPTTCRPRTRQRPGRDRRQRPVHHADRRQGAGCSRRPGSPTGRCRRTTSRRSRRCPTRSTASRTTRPGAGVPAPGTTATNPAGYERRSSRTCSPPTG